MNVYFYNFSKRRNSTKRPGSASASYSCTLKEGTSTSRPSIMIKWQGGSAPASYNYAYIPAFNRYYWVNAWTYDERCWTASCAVDVLATYKSQIGSSSKYVLRSASEYDPWVIDTLYTPKLQRSTAWSGTATGFTNWAKTLAGGTIIIGIVGMDDNVAYSAGGVSYYSATPANYIQFLSDMYTESLANVNGENYGSTIAEAFKAFSRNLLRSISNPTQYVKSVMWFPFSFTTSSGVHPTVGGITSNATFAPLSDPIKKETISFSCGGMSAGDTPKWKQSFPFVRVTAYLPPYGTFDIDTRKLGTGGGVKCYVTSDAISGQSHLLLTGSPVSALEHEPTFADTLCQVGVPMDFSGIKTGNTSISAVTNTAASVTAGDALGAAAGVLNLLESSAPSVESRSSFGGISGDIADKYVETISYDPPEEDVTEHGRPLCKTKTISTLSGFVMCADGDVSCNATQEEHGELESFLTGGFFYE